MRSLFIYYLILLFPAGAVGQDNKQAECSPVGGTAELAALYLGINYTPEQKFLLDNQRLELTFSVDETGAAILETVRGITDSGIIDSMFNVTPGIPKFSPAVRDGIPESCAYTLQLDFPSFFLRDQAMPDQPLTQEEIDGLELSGTFMELIIGGLVNTHSGIVSKYLYTGGGMKLEIMFGGLRMNGGLVMNVYGNKSKREYPIVTTWEQNNVPPTLLLGLGFGKTIIEKEKHAINIQLDLCYAMHNVVSTDKTQTEEYVQFTGFSPGFIVNYMLRIGKDRFAPYYAYPAVRKNKLNFHFAIRPIFLDSKQASGVMYEGGISYRMQLHHIAPPN